MPSSSPPRRRAARVVLVATALAVALAGTATGCVGRLSRNDDHVGPTSVRPDARPASGGEGPVSGPGG